MGHSQRAEDKLNPKNLTKKAEVSVEQMEVGPGGFFVSSIYVFLLIFESCNKLTIRTDQYGFLKRLLLDSEVFGRQHSGADSRLTKMTNMKKVTLLSPFQ